MTPCFFCVCTQRPPCVDSERLRVYGHHAHMLKHACAWCWFTRGRIERTHGDVWSGHTGFSACHTPHTTHHTTTQDTTYHNTPQQHDHNTSRKQRQTETERDTERRRRQKEKRRERTKEKETKERERERKRERTGSITIHLSFLSVHLGRSTVFDIL